MVNDMSDNKETKQAPAVDAGARDERAALIAERDAAIMSTHRQALCIQQCAAHIGQETSATIDGLPLAVKRVVQERDEARAALARASEVSSDDALEWLAAEVFAVDTWHRGSPSYEHDANWMKSEALHLIVKAKTIFVRASEAAAGEPVKGPRWKSARTEPPKMDAPPHFSITVLGVVDDPRFHNQDDNKPFVDIVAYWPALNKWTITHSSIKDVEADDFEVSVAWWMPIPSAPVSRKYRLAAPQPASEQQSARELSDEPTAEIEAVADFLEESANLSIISQFATIQRWIDARISSYASFEEWEKQQTSWSDRYDMDVAKIGWDAAIAILAAKGDGNAD